MIHRIRNAAALLRGHVRRRTEDRTYVGFHLAQSIPVKFGNAKVQHLDQLVIRHPGIGNDEQIVGFEIAVNDATFVRRLERRRRLHGVLQCAIHLEAPLTCEPLG